MKIMKNKYLSIFWGAIVMLLSGLFVHAYCSLSYNLVSIYDEAYFYILEVFTNHLVTYTCPPSLAMDALHALIPNIEHCDILALRRIAFIAKGIALLFLLVSSGIYLHRRFSEKRIYPYLAMSAMYLLIGVCVCPNVVFSWDDVIFILVTIIFALCLLFSVANNRITKYVCIILIGMVALFTLLCNAPAGSMVIVLCVIFLIFEERPSIKHSVRVLFCGLGGVLIGLAVSHFFIINLHDIYSFFLENILDTTNKDQAAAHGLTTVILVIILDIRDLIITMLVLCGITYISVLCQKRFGKSWLTLALALVCFCIVHKWQVRPQITISAILCWYTFMFLLYHLKHKAIKRHELFLIIFAFILPIMAVFGTNTSIIRKPLSCTSASWGFLLFFLYYLSRQEVRKYALFGIIIITFIIIEPSRIMFKSNEEYHFDIGAPVARMNLNVNQKAFYDEVYEELADKGYIPGQDTILGFCFNDMTILAMNAIPYTNDQQPAEFLKHDLKNLPAPNYMILTEWDSIVLYNRLSELEWGFPEGYTYYKCINHPESNIEYTHTNSIIYCKIK